MMAGEERIRAAVALELDVTPPHMGVLMSPDDCLSMSSLAQTMDCDTSNITWIANVEKLTPDEQRTFAGLLSRVLA